MNKYQSTPDYYRDYISHHGIQGQKWGVKNGPPYPLGSNISTGKRLKKSAKTSSNRKKTQENRTKEGMIIPVGLAAYALAGLTMGAIAGGMSITGHIKKSKVEKIIKNSPKDPKTGLSLKQTAYTDKQDIDMVNPGRLTGDEGYHSNCASCTMTYELRRRGYEVTVNKNPGGIYGNEYSKYFDCQKPKKIGNRKSSSGTGSVMVWANESNKEHKEYAKSVIEALNKLPKGSRGNIGVGWGQGGGHSMHYEIGDNGVIVRDAQIKRIYSNEKQLIDLFSDVVSTQYTLLDNAKLKPKYIKEVCH